ncbi:hypothetical protein FND50_21350 [Rhodococcus sp. WB9]|nr:hypothetical protein FND50_21350 [Rhodococcus sp. WB9]
MPRCGVVGHGGGGCDGCGGCGGEWGRRRRCPRAAPLPARWSDRRPSVILQLTRLLGSTPSVARASGLYR